MGMGFAPTWLRQVSPPPPASQNHFNHCLVRWGGYRIPHPHTLLPRRLYGASELLPPPLMERRTLRWSSSGGGSISRIHCGILMLMMMSDAGDDAFQSLLTSLFLFVFVSVAYKR